MTYCELLDEAYSYNVSVKEKPLIVHDGLCNGRKIAIRKNIPTHAEKACVLAEELGHFHYTVGNILDQNDINNRKQEQVARFYAYNKQVGLNGIIEAFNAGCRNQYEMAEYLGITEKFLDEAITRYRSKYGLCTKVDNYIIYFEPTLIVIKMF